MKTFVAIVAVVMGLALAAPLMAQSMDYSKMSTDELYQLKQEPDHQNDMNLQSEWVKRAANMTPEQLKEYKVPYSHQEVQKMYQQQQSPGATGGD